MIFSVKESTRLLQFPTHQAITSTGTKKGELLLADVGAKLINKNITTDFKVDNSSNARRTLLMRHEAKIKENAYWLGWLAHSFYSKEGLVMHKRPYLPLRGSNNRGCISYI